MKPVPSISAGRMHSASPISFFNALFTNWWLIAQLTRHEIASRYRGSVLGVAWSLVTPMVMLAVYTFVFSVVFDAKWGVEKGGGKGDFAVVLFAGMIVFNIFSECFNRSPAIIVGNVNYVKKLIFPLDVLPVVVVGSAAFNSFIGFGVLMVAEILLYGVVPATVLLLPLVVIPFLFAMCGLSLLMAAIGVYFRDISQITGLLTTVIMFSSPLFFPLSALPEHLQPLLSLNPLAYFIESVRAVAVFGELPSLLSLLASYIVSISFTFFGYMVFQKSRRGFADVL